MWTVGRFICQRLIFPLMRPLPVEVAQSGPMPQTSWQINCCSMWGWCGEFREQKTGENIIIWWHPQLDLCFSLWVPTWSSMKGFFFSFSFGKSLKYLSFYLCFLQIFDQRDSVGHCTINKRFPSGSWDPPMIVWLMWLGIFFWQNVKNLEKSDSSSHRLLADNYKCLNFGQKWCHVTPEGAPICLQVSLLGPWKAYDGP